MDKEKDSASRGVTVEICSICAWRDTCQKKFSISGKDIRCADFVKDISIKEKSKEDKEGMER